MKTNKDNWDELREHAHKMKKHCENGTRAQLMIAYVWKDVLNKMWSIEKKGDKDD